MTPMFLPVPSQHGGSPTGNSYLSQFHTCRRKWFLTYLYPHASGEKGLRTHAGSLRLGKRGLVGPGSNLMLGSMLHTFREAWYISGVKDGEDTGQYNAEAALAALQTYTASRRDEFETQEAFDWALAEVSQWCEAFHRHFGPDGYTPLWPEEKLLCMEDGRPAVELEFSVPLGYQDYAYTCRMDAITLFQGKYVLGQEHKSAAASWVDRYISQLAKKSQFTGELWVLRNHPELKALPWEGIQVNFHIKGWTPKSVHPRPVSSGRTSRRPESLEAFRMGAIQTLQEIETAVQAFEAGRAAGDDLAHLMDTIFPETGERTGACYAFASECEFMSLCQMGVGPHTLGNYRPARPAEEPTPEEE